MVQHQKSPANMGYPTCVAIGGEGLKARGGHGEFQV